MIFEVSEEPKKKNFRVRKSTHHKFHVARRRKSSGDFHTLCGLWFRGENTIAETIKTCGRNYCRRCQRASSKKQYDGFRTWKRIVGIRIEENRMIQKNFYITLKDGRPSVEILTPEEASGRAVSGPFYSAEDAKRKLEIAFPRPEWR